MNNHPIKYWEMAETEIFKQFQSDKNGLSFKEAEKRLLKFGKNEIRTQDKRTALGIFISQFKNPLVLILLVASLIAGFLGEFSSTIIIVLILLVGRSKIGPPSLAIIPYYVVSNRVILAGLCYPDATTPSS